MKQNHFGRISLTTMTVAVMVVAMVASLALNGPVFARSNTNLVKSEWWERVERLGDLLAKGRYERVRKAAPKLARDVAGLSWHHPDLKEIFAELALYEAVARAFLGEQDDAVWLWHVAQNIDIKMRNRDLAPYGDAGELFRENPLRASGEVPYRWSHAVQGSQFGTKLEAPRKLGEDPPVVLQSSGVGERGATRPLRVEMILDENGHVHQPVALLPVDAHPAIQWSVLRWIPDRSFAAGTVDGEPRPFLFYLDVAFVVLRGATESHEWKAPGMSDS